MDAEEIFITTLTEKTGITYETIVKVYKESTLTDLIAVRNLFMERFQMSMGFASTLAEIIMSKE